MDEVLYNRRQRFERNSAADNDVSAITTSSSAIAERPRCRVGYLSPKVEDWNWETIFMDIIGLYLTTATYMASKEIEIGEKTQNKGYYAFKFIQGHPRSSRSVPIESPYATSY